jgi:hypothetical protein
MAPTTREVEPSVWRPTELDGFTEVLDLFNIHILRGPTISTRIYPMWWVAEKRRYNTAFENNSSKALGESASLHDAINNDTSIKQGGSIKRDPQKALVSFLESACTARIIPGPVEIREFLLELFHPQFASSTLVREANNASVLENPISLTQYQYPPIIYFYEDGNASDSGSSTAVESDQSESSDESESNESESSDESGSSDNSVDSHQLSSSDLLRQPLGHLDCAYWIRPGISDRFSLGNVGYHVFVSWKNDMTPYFSIVMDDLEDSIISQHHRDNYVLFKLVVAGVVRLYNRYVIWEDMISHEEKMRKRKNPRSEMIERTIREEDELLHFGLTIYGNKFNLYMFKPTLEDSRWNGCKVQVVHSGDLTDSADLKELVDDVEKIHKWAIALYTESIWCSMQALYPGTKRSDPYGSL